MDSYEIKKFLTYDLIDIIKDNHLKIIIPNLNIVKQIKFRVP